MGNAEQKGKSRRINNNMGEWFLWWYYDVINTHCSLKEILTNLEELALIKLNIFGIVMGFNKKVDFHSEDKVILYGIYME